VDVDDLQTYLIKAESLGGKTILPPVGRGGPPKIIFYVDVDDLQTYLIKAESLGGKTILPPVGGPRPQFPPMRGQGVRFIAGFS
jgi:predicted enzyme related to lactoylglutathione lyase